MRRSKRGSVRGSLLAEVSGWGMDVTARAAATVPAVTLDMGMILGSGGGMIGEWEATVDRALTLAERIGCIPPSIMWFDKPITSRPYGGRL